MDKFLVDDYLVGNSITIADFAIILRLIIVLRIFPISDERFPNIFSYIETMKSWSQFNVIEESVELLMDYVEKMKSEQK